MTRADAIRSLFSQAVLAKAAELVAKEEKEPVETDLLAYLAARPETEITEVV